MALIDLEKLDEQIAKQKERLDDRPPEEYKIDPSLQAFPWTKKMKEAFEDNIKKSDKCHACKYMNYGAKIVTINHLNVMRENLPLPTIVCSQCGTLFIPSWARRIMKQAIEEENKILKMRQQESRRGE